MPQTIEQSADGQQIIGGSFSSNVNAENALAEFRALNIPDQNIQVLKQLSDKSGDATYQQLMTERGVEGTQALYYDKSVRDGKTLILIYGVIDPAPIIDVFDRNKAEYNPDGSRNAREDVSGMTAGAAIGAAAGGAVGALVAGPLGAAAGVAAGAIVGGGGGAAAGKAAEHNK
jgi:hypothetical protein